MGKKFYVLLFRSYNLGIEIGFLCHSNFIFYLFYFEHDHSVKLSEFWFTSAIV